MKKLIIGIGALGVMSFTTNQLINTFLLSEAINNVQDMNDWMVQDQESGVIDSVYAEYYLNTLNETEDLLIDFYKLNTNK